MINFRVADLDALLAQLRREGVKVDERTEKSEFGYFGWAMDPEGNRIELWEPPELKRFWRTPSDYQEGAGRSPFHS